MTGESGWRKAAGTDHITNNNIGSRSVGRLDGKRIIITGAGTGIGEASAIRVASEGAKVLVVGRTEETISDTVDQIRNAGGTAEYLIADATVEEQVAGMVSTCVDRFGGLDVFYANAGNTERMTPLLDMTVDQWEQQFRDNVISAFLCVKYAGRHMVDHGGGSIILCSSVASLRANGGAIAYSAVKAGVNSLTQTAAAAFIGKNIRVNALLPGLAETKLSKPIFEYARNKGSEHKLGKLTLMQRPGYVEDMAGVIAFLASDDSSYVDGQLIACDGGISATHPFGRFA